MQVVWILRNPYKWRYSFLQWKSCRLYRLGWKSFACQRQSLSVSESLKMTGNWTRMVLAPSTQEKSHIDYTPTHQNHFFAQDKKFLSPTSTGLKFFLSKTASERVRVTQGDRKLDQDGPCSIYTREKSHRLHSGPPKKTFLTVYMEKVIMRARHKDWTTSFIYCRLKCIGILTYLVK